MHDAPMIELEDGRRDFVRSIYGIGRNYEEHAKELGNQVPVGEPVVFLKAPSSVRGVKDGALAFSEEAFHFEAELVLRIGSFVKMGSGVDWDVIDGIALGLDLTRREKQSELKAKGLPWTLAKSFAGSSVLTPFVLKEHWRDVRRFEFKFYVNDALKQHGDTNQMIFDVSFLLKFLNSFNHLYPGDLIFTGTPSGVGPMKKGDRFKLELLNPVREWIGIL